MEAIDVSNGMPENTRQVFDKFSDSEFINKYTLIGGTALSIQLRHRLSEDLDFILDADTINNASIKREVAKIFPDFLIIRDEKDYQLDFVIHNCKVTFIATGTIALPFRVKPLSIAYKNINIAQVETIAVLKLSALAQRTTFRDYYDLYYIARHRIPLKNIFELTKKLNPNLSPITYSETIIYTKDIPEESMGAHLEPQEVVTKAQLEDFFIKELKKINEK